MNLNKYLIFVGYFLLTSCATSSQFNYESEAIGVMAYNLENLFDTKHDKGTEDFSYLPLSAKQSLEHRRECQKVRSKKYRAQCLELDWNEDVLDRKMKRLADAILQVNNGRGPDLLLVEEVENKEILTRLSQGPLKAANYQTIVLIEGYDKRGIDVGMLSRFPLVGEPQLHKIPYKGRNAEDQTWMNRSRGILQSTFQLPDGQKLTAFGIHFPSPSNPTYWRKQAIEHLHKLQAQIPEDHLVIAGGDFNIAGDEDKVQKLYGDDLSKNWLVSHLIGCFECKGTNYYHTKRQWSFLDALLFEKDMDAKSGRSSWYVDSKSIGIPNHSRYQVNRFMNPARFETMSAVGVSDHWPIFAVLRKRNSKTEPKTMATNP